MKKIAISLILIFLSVIAHAEPCTGVVRTINESKKLSIANVMAKKLKTKSADIFEYMQVGAWRIIWVDTHDSEPGVFFFHGNPINTKYITVFGGAAIYGEENEVIKWAKTNAPGIPTNLAACFAWRVSPEGREQAAGR
jgi:hypothetical protein